MRPSQTADLQQRERLEQAKLKAPRQAARLGWADVGAGRYTDVADSRADLIDILAWTNEQFGATARLRQERLIIATLRGVATQPGRPGSIARPEL